jgi:hypothetical protein
MFIVLVLVLVFVLDDMSRPAQNLTHNIDPTLTQGTPVVCLNVV